MDPTVITSRNNSLLRRAREVRDGKVAEWIFIEGLRLCEEALRSGLQVETVIFSEQLVRKEKAAKLLRELATICNKVVSVSESLLATISYTKTPPGIIALAMRPKSQPDSLLPDHNQPPLLVVMHRLNNPVNVGAILRSAEAAGATGAVATKHTTDPFSAKALRGSMGSAFRLPMWIGPDYSEVLNWCVKRNIHTVCAELNAATLYTDINWRSSKALIVGPEATGLTPKEISAADATVRIPMQGEVESLNVAVAAGVLLYEAARQRRSGQRDPSG